MQLISTISKHDPSGIIVVQSDHGPQQERTGWTPRIIMRM